MNKEPVAIIGAGPAGIAASVQLTRCGIEPYVFEKNVIGGLLRNANFIENYPGFPNGISGVQLVKLLDRHLRKNHIRVRFEEVLDLVYQNKKFILSTTKNQISVKTVIIASGTEPNVLFRPAIPRKLHNRVYYDAYAMHSIKNKSIAIIGGGDAAFDYAIGLGHKNHVIIINRSPKPKCLPVLWNRATSDRNIGYRCDVVKEIVDMNGRILLYLVGEDIALQVNYLLVAIGRKPDTGFLSNSLRKKINELRRKKRLFLIGDVRNGDFRQTAIAVGDGIKAAMEIYGSHCQDRT